MYLENPDELIFRYSQFYNLVEFFKPDLKQVLMIGGAGYSYPKYFLQNFPSARMDVVEIDPGMTKIAQQYFALKPNDRLRIVHQDARVYLHTAASSSYEAIFGDAFQAYYSLPFQLTTKEAAEDMFRVLTDDGVARINIVAALEGDKGKFLRAEYATFKTVFKEVYLFPVSSKADATVTQNYLLIALKKSLAKPWQSENEKIQTYLDNLWTKAVPLDMPILTDEFAPVDQYMMANFR